MVFSAKSRNSAGTSSFGSIMVAILQFELRVTTFPERRLCGVCLGRRRWTRSASNIFYERQAAALFFAASCASRRLRCREAIAIQRAKQLLDSEGDIQRYRKEGVPQAFLVAEPCPLRHLECGTELHRHQTLALPSARSGNRHVPNHRMHGSRQFIVGSYLFG